MSLRDYCKKKEEDSESRSGENGSNKSCPEVNSRVRKLLNSLLERAFSINLNNI